MVNLWDVLDGDGEMVYEAWFYMGDSGTIFRAGTLNVVAEIVQGGIEPPRHSRGRSVEVDVEVLRAALISATRAVRDQPHGRRVTISTRT